MQLTPDSELYTDLAAYIPMWTHYPGYQEYHITALLLEMIYCPSVLMTRNGKWLRRQKIRLASQVLVKQPSRFGGGKTC